MDNSEKILGVYLHEYSKLKEEQTSRIGFRDNLIYVTLAAVGGVFAFVLSENALVEVLFIIPWVCFVLGWIYIANDEKISSIGKYIRGPLTKEISSFINSDIQIEPILGWEKFHRSDKRRIERKILQFSVDCITFVAPGALALVYYVIASSANVNLFKASVLILEFLLLIGLLFKIFRYSDFSKK